LLRIHLGFACAAVEYSLGISCFHIKYPEVVNFVDSQVVFMHDRRNVGKIISMLSLPLSTGYAIVAMRFIAECHEPYVLIKDVAEKTDIPKPYLSKLFRQLAKTGILRSKRGYRGGVALARPADQILFMDVVEAIQGREWKRQCILGFPECNNQIDCPLEKLWCSQKTELEEKFRKISLADLAASKGGWRAAPVRSGEKPGNSASKENISES
jgi:Rrf2 family protein